MNSKSIIWAGMVAGSLLGGFIPSLWGAGMFSMSSIVWTAIGGIAGIWIGFKLS